MAEFRRLRTQAERSGEAWRQVADTRPGYATYPTSRPGDPSWWQRPVDPIYVTPGQIITQSAWMSAPQPGPPPVDGETCKQWCGYCHLGSDPGPEPPQVVIIAPPPRRRWWHRYTRRNS